MKIRIFIQILLVFKLTIAMLSLPSFGNEACPNIIEVSNYKILDTLAPASTYHETKPDLSWFKKIRPPSASIANFITSMVFAINILNPFTSFAYNLPFIQETAPQVANEWYYKGGVEETFNDYYDYNNNGIISKNEKLLYIFEWLKINHIYKHEGVDNVEAGQLDSDSVRNKRYLDCYSFMEMFLGLLEYEGIRNKIIITHVLRDEKNKPILHSVALHLHLDEGKLVDVSILDGTYHKEATDRDENGELYSYNDVFYSFPHKSIGVYLKSKGYLTYMSFHELREKVLNKEIGLNDLTPETANELAVKFLNVRNVMQLFDNFEEETVSLIKNGDYNTLLIKIDNSIEFLEKFSFYYQEFDEAKMGATTLLENFRPIKLKAYYSIIENCIKNDDYQLAIEYFAEAKLYYEKNISIETVLTFPQSLKNNLFSPLKEETFSAVNNGSDVENTGIVKIFFEAYALYDSSLDDYISWDLNASEGGNIIGDLQQAHGLISSLLYRKDLSGKFLADCQKLLKTIKDLWMSSELRIINNMISDLETQNNEGLYDQAQKKCKDIQTRIEALKNTGVILSENHKELLAIFKMILKASKTIVDENIKKQNLEKDPDGLKNPENLVHVSA